MTVTRAVGALAKLRRMPALIVFRKMAHAMPFTPVDVTNALQNQNVQISGGQLGGTPAPSSQRLTASITEATLLRTPAGRLSR